MNYNIFILPILFFTSCEKHSIKKNCFESMGCAQRAYSYQKDGETVYLIERTICDDVPSIVVDKNCEEICTLSGTWNSSTCGNYFETATDKKLVWEKEDE